MFNATCLMLLIDVIIAFITPCLMLLLLLVLLWWCYSSCYSLLNGVSSSCSLLNVVASIVAFYLTLLLFNLFVLNTTCSSICLLHHDVDVPCSLFLVRHCCSYSSYFRLIIPPLSFLQVWEELSKFKFFEPNLEGEIFFKKIFVCWWSFLFPSSHWVIHHHHRWTFRPGFLTFFFGHNHFLLSFIILLFVIATYYWALHFLFLPLLSLQILF